MGLDAAVGLDLETGDLRLVAWASDEEPPESETPILVLAAFAAAERADHRRRLSEGLDVALSEEVVEEIVARAAARRGASWARLDEKLDAAYEEGRQR